MNHYVVVYNPAAGQGAAGRRLLEVERLLEACGVNYRLVATRYPGDAIDRAEEVARSNHATAIIAAGGDGTFNEVLNGLMRVRESGGEIPPIGVLPVGRGNDFAYGAGIPTDLRQSVRALTDGEIVSLDIGFLKGGLFPDGRYFGNGIGIGFDTIVGFEAARMKRVKGFAAYLVGAVKTLVRYYRAPMLRIVTDGGEERRPCIQVSIMNGRRMGGAFHMAPNADPADGLLDLCIAGTPRRLQMLGLIVRYLKGTQATHPHITVGSTSRFHVSSDDGPIAIHADGETVSVDGTELEVRCVPGMISVLRPRPEPFAWA
ncbi:MAG: diacylglycerol/lipid kinase family protein [Spirochaetota bacterium]